MSAKKGQSIARNTGIAASTGEVILFTDDDVVPAPDWLERMATPLLRGDCDAVVGRIELEPLLVRPWMNPLHRAYLVATDERNNGEPELIGANMGFRRSVLKLVPAFDPELGPGALGYISLASAAEEDGNEREAQACFRRALALCPWTAVRHCKRRTLNMLMGQRVVQMSRRSADSHVKSSR